MSESERSERLFRLTEALERALAAGEGVDVPAWALRFELAPGEVRDALRGVELLLDLGGTDEEAELAPPELPEDYELAGELGRGGMGVVYRAHQRSLQRDVAVKVLRPGELVFGEALRRFRREARALARLRHPHIVAIHEVGERDRQLYYSMDLIEGGSLARLIASGELTPSRSVRILRQVASAIAYSHAHGIVHRDLKPQNVLVDEQDVAYVVDFGLARDLAVQVDLTQSGRLLGTPAYMAPEQARGDVAQIGERTDVYALGAVLYECLTGRAPFAGRGLADMVHAVVHDEPEPPRALAPGVPAELERVCLKAMEKDPERRYATARALLEDLERFEEGRPVSAPARSPLRRLVQGARRDSGAVRATAITLALVALAFWELVLPRLSASPEVLLDMADELARSGEPRAAARVYAQVLDGRAPAPGLAAAYAEALLGAAGEARREGRREEADAALERADELLAGHVQRARDDHGALRDGTRSRLAIPAAQVAAAAGDAPAAAQAAQALLTGLRTQLHWLDDVALLRWAPGAPEHVYGPGVDGEGVLIALALDARVDLVDRRSARHALAWHLWADLLGSGERGALLGALAAEGGGCEDVLVALVAGLDDAPEGARFEPESDLASDLGGWRELRAQQSAARLLAGALELAADGERRPPARDAALWLAAQAADLPWTPARAEEVSRAEAAELLRELAALPALDAARERVRFAFARLEGASRGWNTELRRWLSATLGLEELATTRLLRDAVQPLWEERGEDLRAWLAAEQGLDPGEARDPRALFAALAEAEGAARRRLHGLLSLAVGPEVEPPAWPAGARAEPTNLCAQWAGRLGLASDEPPVRLCLAALRLDLRAGGLELLWSEERALLPGEELRVEFEHELLEPWTGPARDADGLPTALGVRLPTDEEPRDAARVPVTLRGRLAWRPEGRVLVWRGPQIAPGRRASSALVNAHRPYGSDACAARAGVAAFLDERVWPRSAAAARVLVLARFEEPAEERFGGGGVAAWTAALEADLAHALADWRERERERGRPTLPSLSAAPRLGAQLELASWLPVSAAGLDTLRELGARWRAATRRGLASGADLAARLAAGDGSFLEEPAEAMRFRESYQRSERTDEWWAALSQRPAALSALDEPAREWLAEVHARRRAWAGPGSGPNARQWLVLRGLGWFVVAVVSTLVVAAVRAAWRHRRSAIHGASDALWMITLFVQGCLFVAPGGAANALWMRVVVLLLAAGVGLLAARCERTPWVRLVAGLLGGAAAAWGLGAALGVKLPLAVGALLAGSALLASVPATLEVWRARAGVLRRLQVLFALSFVGLVAWGAFAEGVAALLHTLGASGAAQAVPGWRAGGAHSYLFLGVLIWALWTRSLGHGAEGARPAPAGR